MMERSEILATMNALKLYGMKSAYDEIIATAIKREHQPERIVSDLLSSEIVEKQARSIKYQMTIAKLPLAKDIADFSFTDTGIDETLVRDLAAGNFLALQRNLVLIGGTGTGKTHLAIASPAPDGRGAWPTIWGAKTSSCSMNWAICPLPSPAANCCSI